MTLQSVLYILLLPILSAAFLTTPSRLSTNIQARGLRESTIDIDDTLVQTGEDIDYLETTEIKNRLLDLLPKMTGTPEEFKAVETYVNTLEERYSPVQTIDFLNMAMTGEWQLLFSTGLSKGPKPNFRLRELLQRVETKGFEGNITNVATWDLAEDGVDFLSSGSFSVKCSYSINQGARMVTDLEDHVLELAKGSTVPKDVEGLVGLLHRQMPNEMFDPSEHALDTTYLDGDLRIVRMTGPKFESVRDIFIRKGSININPTSDQ